jgi:hypothetical protein
MSLADSPQGGSLIGRYPATLADYAFGSNPPYELLRLARKRNLETQAATKQPDGQITQNLSSPFEQNIPFNPSGKSVI